MFRKITLTKLVDNVFIECDWYLEHAARGDKKESNTITLFKRHFDRHLSKQYIEGYGPTVGKFDECNWTKGQQGCDGLKGLL